MKSYFSFGEINVTTLLCSVLLNVILYWINNYFFKSINRSKLIYEKKCNLHIEVHHSIIKNPSAIESNKYFAQSINYLGEFIANYSEVLQKDNMLQDKDIDHKFSLIPLNLEELDFSRDYSVITLKNNSTNAFEILHLIDAKGYKLSAQNLKERILFSGDSISIFIQAYDSPQSICIDHNGTIIEYKNLHKKLGYLSPRFLSL